MCFDDAVTPLTPDDPNPSGDDPAHQSQHDDESSSPSASESGMPPPKGPEGPPKIDPLCSKRFTTAAAVIISDAPRDLLIEAEIKGNERRIRCIAPHVPVNNYDMAKRIKDRIQRVQCRVTTNDMSRNRNRVHYDPRNDETYPINDEEERAYKEQVAAAIRDWNLYHELMPHLIGKSVLEQQKKILGRQLWYLSVEVLSWDLVVSTASPDSA